MDNSTKFVKYDEYCRRCKDKDTIETAEPCDECLSIGAREGTEKPINFKEKE